MITSEEEWDNEYTSDEEYNIHKAKRIIKWENWNTKKFQEYIAEVKWNKRGKLEKEYMITLYDYKYTSNDDDEGEGLVKFEIIERKQYKTRNAMMNRMRKLEEKQNETLLCN